MYKRDYAEYKSLASVGAIASSIILFIAIVGLSKNLTGSSEWLFYKDAIGWCLLLYIPLNVLGWLCLGQVGGILIFILSCLSIIYIVLKHFILSYSGYTVLFGIAAIFGYRFFLRQLSEKNRSLIKIEAYEGDKNNLAAGIAKKESEITAAKNRASRYRALKDITEDLSSTLELEKAAALITNKALDVVGNSGRCLLYLINEQRQELELFSYSEAAGSLPPQTKRPELFDIWLLKQRRSLIVEDLDNDFRFSTEALKDKSAGLFKSIIGVPLMSEMKVAGTLRLDSAKKAAYTQDDLRLLDIISDLAAVSIENSKLYQRTNELAITDGLTGLYVQRFFKDQLEVKFKEAAAGANALSLLMIDLDHFKKHNDKYGHAAGDLLLARVADVLRAHIGQGHIISRYGGEEFAVILTGTSGKTALDIAEKVRKGVEGSVFMVRREQIKMTVSIGVSSFPKDARTAAELLKDADSRLYRAKENGRNQVCLRS